MKKLMVLLAVMVVLGKLSLTEWQNLPQTEFLKYVGQVFCEQTNCKKALIGAIEIGDKVFITADCLDKNEIEL